jgi:hypothetical protein
MGIPHEATIRLLTAQGGYFHYAKIIGAHIRVKIKLKHNSRT